MGGAGRVGDFQRPAPSPGPRRAVLPGAQGHAGQPREGAGPAAPGSAPARTATAEESHLSGLHQVQEETDALQRETERQAVAKSGQESRRQRSRHESLQVKEDNIVQNSTREETRQEVQVQVQQEAAARQLQRPGLGRLDHRAAGLRGVPLRGRV